MIVLALLAHTALFALTCLGLAWPLVARAALEPAEKLLASLLLSLAGIFAVAWTIYLSDLPAHLHLALPVAALAAMLSRVTELRATFRDRDARALLIAQLLVTTWCLGWLAFVLTYSGGSWAGDWFGHWLRSRFFLVRPSPEILFGGIDPLPSRPPLANVTVAAFLAFGPGNFAHYQLLMTVLSSAAFLPAALLARRFRGSATIPLLAALCLFNPSFVQNATFAWTKLPAALGVLAALYFYLRGRDLASPTLAALLTAVSLATAILVHYSAVPFALLLGAAWLRDSIRRRHDRTWWQATVAAVLAATALLSLWFGWTLVRFGGAGTFFTNSTVTDRGGSVAAHLTTIALNLRDTLVPPFLRNPDVSLLTQASPWGALRDLVFLPYQLNVPLFFGSVAWAAIVLLICRHWRIAPRATRAFWVLFVGGGLCLGVAVHSGRAEWGVAHVCLQSLLLVGLAFLAAYWPTLGSGWRAWLLVGAALDFTLGVALQFGCQSLLLDRWLTPDRPLFEAVATYSSTTVANTQAKLLNDWIFLGDLCQSAWPLVALALATIAALALQRARRATPAP